MKRILLVLGIAILAVLSFIGVVMAGESYVLSDVSGAVQHGGVTIVDKDYGWKSAPENPDVVYIAVWTPAPYREYIQNALVAVVKKHGLKPAVVSDVTEYDLKGRIVIFHAPVIGKGHGLVYREYSISGILYYSYAGDAKSAVNVINNGLTFSTDEISNSAAKFCKASMRRLTDMKIANQTCDVAYWWNLKAKVGRLNNDNPYGMIADEIAPQLDQFLRSDESDKP